MKWLNDEQREILWEDFCQYGYRLRLAELYKQFIQYERSIVEKNKKMKG